MWAIQIFLALLGLSIGFAVAGGLFALIIGMGVVSRFAGKTHTADHIIMYENFVALGGFVGNVLWIYDFPFPPGAAIGAVLLPIIGLCAGIFVGCWYMAIAEMINTFPTFLRRMKILKGMGFIVLGVALGKTAGAFLYFFQRW